MVLTLQSCLLKKVMRYMGLFAVLVLLTVGGLNILFKIILSMERNCSFIMPTLVMMLLFAESFPKPNLMSSTISPGQSHVGISFEIPEVTTQEIANCTLKLLEICRDQKTRQRSIWPVLQKFLEILRTLLKMKIRLSILLLLMG